MSKEQNYDKAYKELTQILSEIENDISIDQLTTKLERAKELLWFCRDKLRNVELQVKDLFVEK